MPEYEQSPEMYTSKKNVGKRGSRNSSTEFKVNEMKALIDAQNDKIDGLQKELQGVKQKEVKSRNKIPQLNLNAIASPKNISSPRSYAFSPRLAKTKSESNTPRPKLKSGNP